MTIVFFKQPEQLKSRPAQPACHPTQPSRCLSWEAWPQREMETSAAFCAGLIDHVCQFDKKKGGEKKCQYDRDFDQLKIEFQSILEAGGPPSTPRFCAAVTRSTQLASTAS